MKSAICKVLVMIPGRAAHTVEGFHFDSSKTFYEQLAIFLGKGVWTEHLVVQHNCLPCDLFFDENGALRELPLNEHLQGVPAWCPHPIRGPAVLFLDRRVWPG